MDATKIGHPELETKDWGVTRTLLRGPRLLFHATVEAGGFCSRHIHRDRTNYFYVVSGTLRVAMFLSPKHTEPCSVATLRAGDDFQVRPGVVHRFECLEKCELLEVYWCDHGQPPDENDIVRYDRGDIVPLQMTPLPTHHDATTGNDSDRDVA